MKLYKKNLKKLINGKVYDRSLEHDACGVGFIASTEGKKTREVVENFFIDKKITFLHLITGQALIIKR